MKKSDEQRNEELRRLLSGTFTNFDRPPANETWGRIRAAVPSRTPWYARRPVQLTAAVILLSGFGLSTWLWVSRPPQPAGDPATKPAEQGVSTPNTGFRAGKPTQPWPAAGRPARSMDKVNPEPVTPAPANSSLTQPSHSNQPQTAASERVTPTVTAAREENFATRPTSPARRRGRFANRPAPAGTRTQPVVDRVAGTSRRKNGDRNEIAGGWSVSRQQAEALIAPLTQRPSSGAADVTHSVGLIDERRPKLALSTQLLRLTTSVRYQSDTKPAITDDTDRQSVWRLTADGMPLSTYQLLTIRSLPEAYVQNFRLPAAFSEPTAGGKLAVGVSRGPWRAQLTATRMKRWAFYEVATNEYRVTPTGPNSSLIARQGIPVSESTPLTLLGLRISRNYALFDRGRLGLFINGGGEAAWSPTTRQGLLFASGSAGMTYQIARQTRLRVAPTVDFSFTRLRDKNGFVQIQPYNVGATVGIETRLSGRGN